MEQLSFNQNLAYAPAAREWSGRRSDARVLGSVSLDTRVDYPARDAGQSGQSSGREGDRKVSAGNVTEIIMPAGQVENFQLLLPMLTQLNRERRWLAWIDPPAELVSKWQNLHGIVAGEILVLRSTADYPARVLAERALGAGTCHAVVMWTEKLGRNAFETLQNASARGNSHGVVLRQR